VIDKSATQRVTCENAGSNSGVMLAANHSTTSAIAGKDLEIKTWASRFDTALTCSASADAVPVCGRPLTYGKALPSSGNVPVV